MKIHAASIVRLTIAAGVLCLAMTFTAAPIAPPTESNSNGSRSLGGSDPAARRGNWKKQEGIPTPWGVYDVDMISATEGWAVTHPITGEHANILHSTNGGKTSKQQGSLFSQLSGISFADLSAGWRSSMPKHWSGERLHRLNIPKHKWRRYMDVGLA